MEPVSLSTGLALQHCLYMDMLLYSCGRENCSLVLVAMMVQNVQPE